MYVGLYAKLFLVSCVGYLYCILIRTAITKTIVLDNATILASASDVFENITLHLLSLFTLKKVTGLQTLFFFDRIRITRKTHNVWCFPHSLFEPNRYVVYFPVLLVLSPSPLGADTDDLYSIWDESSWAPVKHTCLSRQLPDRLFTGL